MFNLIQEFRKEWEFSSLPERIFLFLSVMSIVGCFLFLGGMIYYFVPPSKLRFESNCMPFFWMQVSCIVSLVFGMINFGISDYFRTHSI